jgi:hypothetical protein
MLCRFTMVLSLRVASLFVMIVLFFHIFIADWWDQYGGDYPELQEFARRIVSQCMSSSGCERNCSTFALVHTKLGNRLSYDKLHKLVYVHYNLKLRIQHYETDMESLEQMKNSKDRNIDPCSIMIDVAMYDEANPIMEWLCSSRSESVPTLDENDEPESPNRPSGFVLEELGGLNEEEMILLNSRIGSGRKNVRKRKVVKEDIGDDFLSDSSEGGGSPTYNESGDSDSNDGEFTFELIMHYLSCPFYDSKLSSISL